jgi:hypothetical protein
MPYSISCYPLHSSSKGSDYDSSVSSAYESSEYESSEYESSEYESSEYESSEYESSEYESSEYDSSRVALFSSVESAIVHAHNFVLSFFYNIRSPILPIRRIQDSPIYRKDETETVSHSLITKFETKKKKLQI